ncbi:MAG: amino acid adenylation domain-containing protein, partial [Myxococcaceae bacterium]|nr:amino acid adenylation domain-containing protein [Myxococcaceae bacterium]
MEELPLLTEAERRQVVVEWNQTATVAGGEVCLHELFERQAERVPEAPAVECAGEVLSYGELERRSNRVARHLRRLGVGPEARVGVCLERSVDVVVGLLGVLKAGGAYVPLEPDTALERLRFQLQDAGVRVLLTQQRVKERLGKLGPEVVCLDREPELVEVEESRRVESGVQPSNLAYVIYTSGSSGKPKGVGVEHRQIVNYVCGIGVRLGFVEGARFATVSTLAADLGHTVVFPSLCSGGCLHVVTEELAADAQALGKYVREQRIDYLKIVPSHLRALRGASGAERVMPLRGLVLGGESSPSSWMKEVLAEAGECEVFNHYGPTETTVGVLTYRVELERLPAGAASVPLGRPLPNVRVYVLDGHLQPVPVGVVGEVCIAGQGVARGYLGRGDLTAEKFVPDPFGEEGGRLYRTGDLGRHLSDGDVEFAGRLDQQVKVRGYRIEPGEIEAVLLQHGGVGQAAVVVREDQAGEKRLVAYVVWREGRGVDVSELRAHLLSRVPEAMVPAVFVELERLPLTANGKLDRSALPAPEGRGNETRRGYVAAGTEAERALAKIWTSVLRLERVGIHDNFFELGGDSILCIQVIARAREAGLHLTLKQIFKEPTIAELARAAGEAGRSVAGPVVGTVSGGVELTPIQAWFFEQELEEPQHFNQAVLLELRQRADVSVLERVVTELVRHHDALRLGFEREGSEWRQLQAGEESVSDVFARVDLSGEPDVRAALEEHARQVQTSLNLATGPLLRAVHYDLGGSGERLLLVIHHLAVDGVSWRVLLEDLQTGYEQACQGRQVELPAKTTSFQEWSRRLGEYARSEGVSAESGYWSAEERAGVRGLPLDHVLGDNTVLSACSVTVGLEAEQTRRLLQDVPGVYRTQINDVLLAALAQTLSRWTGSSRVVVELEGHGREELFEGVDLSRTVGWFTSLFPVLLDVEGCNGAGELLKTVKEQVRGVPQRGIGYGLLRYLNGGEAGGRVRGLPQAEVRFNYLGQFDQVLSGSGLFGVAVESSGASRSGRGRRPYLLDVNGLVVGDCLRLEWTYSVERHRKETIEGLAESFVRALVELIEHCRTPEAGGYTPSDFPLAGLDQRELDLCVAGDRDVEDVHPLSPTQQGLLFHGLFAPRAGVYFEQLSCRLEGDLESGAFRGAWQVLAERHALLRTR